MKLRRKKDVMGNKYIMIMYFLLISGLSFAQPLAFPTAEGHGAYTTGGRGGVIIEVTNLNDSGTGSLRAAIEAKGPRIVVFKVSGIIQLKKTLSIKNDDITIAGQTAPGDGICLRDYTLTVDANNVIIRYIRSRLGDEQKQENDAMNGRFKKNIIIDHCSMSWSVDEAASFYSNENFTMQWCIISESLYHSIHDKGDHGYGGIWGGEPASFHHNLLAHHTSRNPRFNGGRDGYGSTPLTEFVDFRNNVIYNWGKNSAYAGEKGNQNMVNNYYKAGPATHSHKNRIIEPYDIGNWYVEGNYVEGYPAITADNWAGGVQPNGGTALSKLRVYQPFPTGPIVTQTPEGAFESVLEYAGCIRPVRDAIDERIVEETRTGTTTFGASYGAGEGIIDTQTDVGGWLVLTSTEAPLDSDHDGMPDEWEDANGLNKLFADDRNNLLEDSTTMVEVYLNLLASPIVYPDSTIFIPDTTSTEIIDTTSTEVVDTTGVGIYTMEQLSDLKVFPNPAQNLVTVQYSLQKDAKMQFTLVDMTGRVVMKNEMEKRFSGLNSFNLDISHVHKGIYFLNLTSATYNSTIKMIVR
ncbi:MAG: T9SS type A sorting domain-containing protein [Prolixibacteraceae bacterium]